jgi:hypothetical protein
MVALTFMATIVDVRTQPGPQVGSSTKSPRGMTLRRASVNRWFRVGGQNWATQLGLSG